MNLDKSKPIEPIEKGADLRRNWRTINQVVGAVNTMRGVQRDGRRPIDTALSMHPFKLYSLPVWQREIPNESDWRAFVVRGGRVNGVEVTGTDGETFPDEPTHGGPSPLVTLTNAQTIVDPGVTAHRFWIRVARDLTSASVQNGTSDFPAFDTADGYLQIPIGWVDTATYSTDKTARVRQLLRTDVFLPLQEFNVKDADCNDKLMMMFASQMYAPPA